MSLKRNNKINLSKQEMRSFVQTEVHSE